jgi:predicted negative regulator of RcsB-dependent stress response
VEDYLDEKEQWERVVAWIREQGPWMLATVVVVLGAFGGWRYWQARRDRIDLAASVRYEQLLNVLDQGQLAQGSKLADQLVHDYPSTPYADQAELAAARVAVAQNQLPQAADRLSHVMTHTHDPELALLARLRLARVQLGEGKADVALGTLDAVNPGAYSGAYAELRGDALLAKGDRAGALKQYLAARSDADSVDSQLLDLKIHDLAHS